MIKEISALYLLKFKDINNILVISWNSLKDIVNIYSGIHTVKTKKMVVVSQIRMLMLNLVPFFR